MCNKLVLGSFRAHLGGSVPFGGPVFSRWVCSHMVGLFPFRGSVPFNGSPLLVLVALLRYVCPEDGLGCQSVCRDQSPYWPVQWSVIKIHIQELLCSMILHGGSIRCDHWNGGVCDCAK